MGLPSVVKVAGERRDHRRAPVNAPAELRCDSGRITAWLHDISRGGAQLEAETPPTLGSVLMLSCDAFCTEAMVAWVSGKRFGVRFLQEVETALLLEQPAANDATGRHCASL